MAEPDGSVILAIACTAIRITGINAVNTLTPKPGISASVNTFGLYKPAGMGLSIFFSVMANSGPEMITVGIARMIP
jgi:hypothetical protein